MTRLNTQFSVKGISLLNSVMASSSSDQFKKFLFNQVDDIAGNEVRMKEGAFTYRNYRNYEIPTCKKCSRPRRTRNGLIALSLVIHFRFEILQLSYFRLCIFSVL